MYESFSFSGESENCYGLKIVERILSDKYGIQVKPLSYQTKDTVLVSLYWPEQIYDFIKWRYQGQMREKEVIVGGNYPTTSPNAVYPFCKNIFLGDGELWDGSLESEYVYKNKPINRSVQKNITAYSYEDIQFSRRSFVEISRGCKNKCLFCQYGWLKEYREVNFNDIVEVIKRTKTKSVRVFSADRFQHSRYRDIRLKLDKMGKCDTGSDMSIKFVLKNPDYLKLTNKVRVGVEGMSERLRRLVLKNYTDDDLIKFCKMVSDAGIKCLDFYMIYGLPTETDKDVLCFKELIRKLDSVMPDKYTIAIHWNAFTPSAQTPFQWEAPARGEFKALKEMFANTGNKKIKIYHKPKLTSEWTLIKRMLAIRGGAETKELLFNMAINKSKFKNNQGFLLREYKKRTGLELMDKWPEDKELPWDLFCIYDKEKMFKLKNIMLNKYGA